MRDCSLSFRLCRQQWVQREWLLAEGNPARNLLAGAKVTFLEAGSAWAIGSNRGAASSIRAYIENAFAWLYYKDHPVEFRAVLARQLDLILPKSVQSYIKSVDNGFDKAYAMIARKRTRSNEYFYTDVSQFVHAHPAFASPSINIEETAVSVPRDASFITLANMADEFISDNFLACYRASWGDIPSPVQENASSRLGSVLAQFVDAA
jgi:hypothetical protein